VNDIRRLEHSTTVGIEWHYDDIRNFNGIVGNQCPSSSA
jgi:hypothetical protein